MSRHRGCTHKRVNWPLHPTSVPVVVACSYSACLSRWVVDGGDLLTVTPTVFEYGRKVHKTFSLDFSPHPYWNSVRSKSPHKVSERNMNYLFKNLRVCLDRNELHGERLRKVSQQQQLRWSKNWYEERKKEKKRKILVRLNCLEKKYA